MPSKSICVAANGKVFFFCYGLVVFLCVCVSVVCVCVIIASLSIHLLRDLYFHVLAVVNNAVVNIRGACIFSNSYFFFFFRYAGYISNLLFGETSIPFP